MLFVLVSWSLVTCCLSSSGDRLSRFSGRSPVRPVRGASLNSNSSRGDFFWQGDNAAGDEVFKSIFVEEGGDFSGSEFIQEFLKEKVYSCLLDTSFE